MKVKKVPMRSCVVTKERLPKKDLIRIVKTPEGTIEIDLTGKKNGHGVYLKKDIKVIEMALKSKVLNSIFNKEIDDSIYEKLKEICNGEN